MNVITGTFTYNADSSPHTYAATGSGATTYSNDAVGDLTVGGDAADYDWSTGRGVPKSLGTWVGNGCAIQCEKLLTDPYGRRTYLNFVSWGFPSGVNTTTCYLYQGQNVVQEWGPNGEARVLNGVGLDERFARKSASGVLSWFLVDRMGSTVALTDVNGNIQTTYTYGPFGQTAVAGANNDNPYQFHGREAEPMNGLFGGMYYFRARYLDSGLSRFVSRDSAGFRDGDQLYNYGGNDAVDFSDTTGRCDLPGAFAGAVLGVAGAAGTSGANGWALAAGGIVGFAVGCLDPLASEWLGAEAAAFVVSTTEEATRQMAANLMSHHQLGPINWWAVGFTGVGAAAGAGGEALEEAYLLPWKGEQTVGGVFGNWVGQAASGILNSAVSPPEVPPTLPIYSQTFLGDFSGVFALDAWGLPDVDAPPPPEGEL